MSLFVMAALNITTQKIKTYNHYDKLNAAVSTSGNWQSFFPELFLMWFH